jgi:hypothetical protein
MAFENDLIVDMKQECGLGRGGTTVAIVRPREGGMLNANAISGIRGVCSEQIRPIVSMVSGKGIQEFRL